MTKFETPPLPYDYKDLEPFVNEDIMIIHHDKHHVAYTTNFNKALEKYPELFNKKAEEILTDINNVPEDIKTAVKNHGGGHVHHSFFWEVLRPSQENNKPQGELLKAIEESFESFQNFQEKFENSAATLFGSGWTWLSLVDNKLIIENTPNQDSPYSLNHKPILTLDIWEHAYYLKYKNVRLDYIKNFWSVVNWNKVEENFKN